MQVETRKVEKRKHIFFFLLSFLSLCLVPSLPFFLSFFYCFLILCSFSSCLVSFLFVFHFVIFILTCVLFCFRFFLGFSFQFYFSFLYSFPFWVYLTRERWEVIERCVVTYASTSSSLGKGETRREEEEIVWSKERRGAKSG